MIDPVNLPPNLRAAMDRRPALVPPVSASEFLRATKANPLDPRNAPKSSSDEQTEGWVKVIRGEPIETAAKCLNCGFERKDHGKGMHCPSGDGSATYRWTVWHPEPSEIAAGAPSCPPEPIRVAREQGKPSAGKKPLPKPRQMNKTERRFADLLDARKRDGKILHWVYEGIRLKWGGGMHYTGDFVVFTGSDCPTIYEVKGAHIRDRDVVRFKGCRAEWPQFPFEMWQWKSGKWTQKY